MTPPRIYVAAASLEVQRAQRVMRDLRERGAHIVGDWTEAVLREGGDGARQTDAQRALLSAEQLAEVTRADGLLLLVPEDVASVGTWIGLGVAWRSQVPVVASSLSPRLPWAAAWVTRVGTDEEAVRVMLRVVDGW